MIKNKQNSFPAVYKNTHLNILLEAFKSGPDKMKKSLEGLTSEELKRHPKPSKWSIIEIIQHVLDSELVGTVRMMKTMLEPGDNLPFYDQDVWVKKMDYNSSSIKDVMNALEIFKLLRLRTAPILESANLMDWEKESLHYEYGNITLRNLLELYADHTERHLEQILELRKHLGKPLELPVVLKRRLY